MIKSLESGELDLAIGLTEGWIASLGNGQATFRLAGKYVDTPLCWAISTGRVREEMGSANDLQGKKKLGISRVGSGSYVMGYVLADQYGWLKPGEEPFEWVVLDNFKNLRDAVNRKEGKDADVFMWEHFTSKYVTPLSGSKEQGRRETDGGRKYYDTQEIRKIGEIYTPWPSWHIVAHSSQKSEAVTAFAEAVNEGVKYFNEHLDEAVKWIAGNLDYSEEDGREWLKTVKFSEDCGVVETEVVEKTLGILKKAGVVKGDQVQAADMVLNPKKA